MRIEDPSSLSLLGMTSLGRDDPDSSSAHFVGTLGPELPDLSESAYHCDQGGTMPFDRAYAIDWPRCSFMCATSWKSTAHCGIVRP